MSEHRVMFSEVNVVLRHGRERAEVDRAPDSIRIVALRSIGSSAGPLEFGRFLLSSAGLHLLLFWALVTAGVHTTSPPERPLQVRLVEVETPKLLPTTPHRLEARTRQQAAPRPSSPPAGPKGIAPRDLIRPPVGAPEVIASRSAEAIDEIDPDDRRQIASRRATGELVKEIGLPIGTAPPPGDRTGAVDNISGPRAVGAPGRIGVIVLPSDGLSSGPAVLGGGDSDGRPASRGGARRLGAELVATLAPTVTVGPRRDAAGRGTDGGGAAARGSSADPAYGANPSPQYPPLAREKGYEGTVYLRVQVQGDGRVGTLTVDRSSGYEILDRAAANSVKEWTFLPAQKDGRPVTSWVLLPVKFMLK